MNKLATPLRAEPEYNNQRCCLLKDAEGSIIARDVPKETAAQLIAMSKDAKRLDWLEETDQRGHYCGVFRGHILTRAVIDAERNKIP